MDTAVRRQIALWLFICSAMVFAMLVVGGDAPDPFRVVNC